MSLTIYCIATIILLLIAALYLTHGIRKHRPDPIGQWLGEVYLVSKYGRELVFRNRYSNGLEANWAAEAAAKRLHRKLKKFEVHCPEEHTYLVDTKYVTIVWSRNVVGRSSYEYLKPVNTHNI
jgi:hypothetical protein